MGSDGRDSHIGQIEGAGEITERSKRSSPDGCRIAFFTDQNGKWGLYVMNADGSDRCPMFETALDGLEFEYGFVPERMVSWTE